MTILISGGSKSGKSMLAQELTLRLAGGGKHYYVATMIPASFPTASSPKIIGAGKSKISTYKGIPTVRIFQRKEDILAFLCCLFSFNVIVFSPFLRRCLLPANT